MKTKIKFPKFENDLLTIMQLQFIKGAGDNGDTEDELILPGNSGGN